MRRILVENARRKHRIQHGGRWERVEVDVADLPTHMPFEQLLALDDALENLRQQDPVKAQLVTLRYFGGLSVEQASQVLNISRVTAHRYWTFARAWLHQQITGGAESDS
jgi:RNA polymerase sigma factor (TIGR02999 family)